MTRRLFGALGALLALNASLARAVAGPAAAAPASPGCVNEATAIGRISCGLAGALASQTAGALVVAASKADDAGARVPATVNERLAQLLAARLGAPARASAKPLALAEAEREASAARGLIYLTVSLFRDRLEVNAEVYTGAGHFWQRIRSPGLHLKTRQLATSPLDPELRALFPAIPLLVTRVEKATVPEQDILALACGDLRGDGSLELLTVGRHQVQVGRIERGRFVARASLDWADHSPVAQSPLREPIAACAVPEPGRLIVGISDRADALELSGSLGVEQVWHGVMPWPGGGCTRRSGLGYDGQARACPGASLPPAADFATAIDAFASGALVNASGELHTLRLARPIGSDNARAQDSLQPEVTVPNVGAQLAVGDLDDDGLPEIVSGSASLARKADELVVRTLLVTGQLRERLRLRVPSGIDALAICPGDGRAMASIALATGDGIWVVR